MAIGTTNYPTALDTLTELIRVVDAPASSTIDTGGVTNVATTIPVVSATSAPADGVALICTFDVDGTISAYELVSYTGKTGTTLTGAVRGFGGTAQAWAAGDFVFFDVIPAAAHDVQSDAIIAIETLLGVQGQNTYKPLYAKALTANLGNTGTTISPFFSTLPGIPIVAGETYELTAYMNFLKNTAGTLVWTLTFSAAPTFVNAELDTDLAAGAALGAAQTATAPLRSVITGGTSAATAFPATASITTATYHQHRLHAVFTCGTTGNVRINVTNSAGTVTPLRGSRYELIRLVDVGTTVA